MSTTVALIAKEAFDDVALEITGVIKTGVLTRIVSTSVNSTTGEVTNTTADYNCRTLFGDRSTIKDYFGDSEIGEGSRLLYLEGLSVEPQKTDKLVSASLTLTIEQTLNVAQANGFYVVVAK